jgi:hypothetical protein
MQWGGYNGMNYSPDPRGYYLDVISREIKLAMEFEDIREHRELFEALDHWRELAPWGVKRFEKGLREGNILALKEAFQMMARYI